MQRLESVIREIAKSDFELVLFHRVFLNLLEVATSVAIYNSDLAEWDRSCYKKKVFVIPVLQQLLHKITR